MSQTTIDAPPVVRSPWTVLTSTSLAVFAVFLDTTILFVAFPSIGRSFTSVSPSSLSWVLNGYTIVFAALLIPAGRLADRIGRRQTFLGASWALIQPLLTMSIMAVVFGRLAGMPSGRSRAIHCNGS